MPFYQVDRNQKVWLVHSTGRVQIEAKLIDNSGPYPVITLRNGVRIVCKGARVAMTEDKGQKEMRHYGDNPQVQGLSAA